MVAKPPTNNYLIAQAMLRQPPSSILPQMQPQVPPVPMPQLMGDADAMKASFARIIDVMRKAGPGSAEWNARAPYVNDMSQKIFNATGEVYSQGNWIKVK